MTVELIFQNDIIMILLRFCLKENIKLKGEKNMAKKEKNLSSFVENLRKMSI